MDGWRIDRGGLERENGRKKDRDGNGREGRKERDR